MLLLIFAWRISCVRFPRKESFILKMHFLSKQYFLSIYFKLCYKSFDGSQYQVISHQVKEVILILIVFAHWRKGNPVANLLNILHLLIMTLESYMTSKCSILPPQSHNLRALMFYKIGHWSKSTMVNLISPLKSQIIGGLHYRYNVSTKRN